MDQHLAWLERNARAWRDHEPVVDGEVPQQRIPALSIRLQPFGGEQDRLLGCGGHFVEEETFTLLHRTACSR